MVESVVVFDDEVILSVPHASHVGVVPRGILYLEEDPCEEEQEEKESEQRHIVLD